MMKEQAPYQPKNKIRIVTAASLFDGHDAAINIMRRIIQSTGCEVIHLGHDRSVEEVVNTAIQEDAQAIAMTSYQGGHMEYFKYMYDLLSERGAGHIKIFGGGGGTILPEEIEELHAYGIARVYHPDDGREMGLQGMINDLVQKADFPVGDQTNGEWSHLDVNHPREIGRVISAVENFSDAHQKQLDEVIEKAASVQTPVLGITGTGGAGKSSLVDELVRRFLIDFPDKHLAVVSVDPSKRKTGGALLGDRIRMNAIRNPRVYMRSLATRQSNLALSRHVKEALDILKVAGFDMIILETSGIGQSDTEILDHSDISLYVMTPDYGAATQLEKIDMLDFADLIALNKFDKRGALDALRDVKKQYQRNHGLWTQDADDMPVFGSIASQFNDPGTNALYRAIMDKLVEKTGVNLNSDFSLTGEMSEKIFIIPPKRTRYLSEISENNRSYDEWVKRQSETADGLYKLQGAIDHLKKSLLEDKFSTLKMNLDPHNWELIQNWADQVERYRADEYIFKVRDREIRVKTHSESLSHSMIPKVAMPRFRSWGDILRWILQENVPGSFPYTSGIYPFKREGEDPTRMFASCDGSCRKMFRDHSPTPAESILSNVRERILRVCSQVKEAPKGPISAFTM
jgi:methylmalonyl-CoA mutase